MLNIVRTAISIFILAKNIQWVSTLNLVTFYQYELATMFIFMNDKGGEIDIFMWERYDSCSIYYVGTFPILSDAMYNISSPKVSGRGIRQQLLGYTLIYNVDKISGYKIEYVSFLLYDLLETNCFNVERK